MVQKISRVINYISGPSLMVSLRSIFTFSTLIILIIPSVCFPIEIIVNPAVSRADLSQSSLRAIFGMRLRNWPNDEPITVFVLKTNNQTHNEFTKNILNMFPHQLQRTWDRLVFSGMGQAPIEVKSMEEMKEKVAETPGSIGYIDSSYLDDTLHVLTIN